MQIILPVSILLLGFSTSIQCYKILGIFHTMSKSHTIVGESLMNGLAEAGHDITMITAYPQKNLPKNVKEIHVEGIFDVLKCNFSHKLYTLVLYEFEYTFNYNEISNYD